METNERLAEIQRMFDLAVIEDQWDMEAPMLYSFYFVSEDEAKLDKLAEELEAHGFDPLEIWQLGDEATLEPTGEYLLHVDQVAVYTPETLEKQLVAFEGLCEERGSIELDGWEFGADEDGEEDDSVIDGLEED
jgi:hypothetical protein